MNKCMFFSILFAILLSFPNHASADKAPRSIAGLTLGEQIDMFVDLVQMETSIVLRDRQYLREVDTREIDGFKSGTVDFGNCSKPGQIVRIKLKYEDEDKKFYDDLLARFKKRFGEPDEWRGDPFHVIIAWKWSFSDEKGNKISLILQHSRDEEYKWGNSVKLTNTTLMEQEQLCFEKKNKEEGGKQEAKSSSQKHKLSEKDYQRFIPQ
ncbi:MAG: hypothetical protein LJE89_06665 [Deltaproteobacteria bacterium]|nr:hypothetical protein [Deltaproteobacteria bacterium]